MFLNKGQRGLLLGKTGSGKTQDALFQLQNAPVYPVVIFDTKIEDAFFSLRTDDDRLEVVESFDDLVKLAKQAKNKLPTYILVRPSADEVREVEPLDKYAQFCYRNLGAHFIYFDEVFNWHKNGIPVPGLLELLGRGRSKGKTTLMGSQRPAWISRSCFTESDHFYIHRLLDVRDKKVLDSVIPEYSSHPNPPKYHFHYFDVSSDDPPKLFSPVPETKIEPNKIYKKNWL